jgi:hypothetical protein
MTDFEFFILLCVLAIPAGCYIFRYLQTGRLWFGKRK